MIVNNKLSCTLAIVLIGFMIATITVSVVLSSKISDLETEIGVLKAELDGKPTTTGSPMETTTDSEIIDPPPPVRIYKKKFFRGFSNHI